MGIIRKQSIYGTLYSYIGVILGFIVTAILFPRILSTEQVGLLKVLVAYSVLFSQFASLGFNAVTVKLFPYFRDKKNKHHGFLGLTLLVSLAGFIISVLAFLLMRSYLIDQSEGKSELFINYFYYVIPLIFFTLLFNVFDTYYRVLYNAVKGIFVKEVVQRVGLLVVVLVFYFGYIDFHTTVLLYLLVLVSPSILLLASLVKNKQLFLKTDFKFIDKNLKKQLVSVGFFGIIASYSGVLVMNIDVLMVNDMLGLSAAGIYTVTFYFGTLILVPLRTMGKISSVVIADSWKTNDLDNIHTIYKKSSLSLSVVGLLLFIGIWGNIDNVFYIIRDDYFPGKMVIFYIGLANLFDIFLGVNPQIIVNSKYYKYLSYFLTIFAILLIITNLLLIPKYGIVGAAIASLISKFLYNFVKFIFLYQKFRFQPFSYRHIILIVIAIASYWISSLIPAFSNYIVDIIIRSTVISILFGIPVYFLKLSPDINDRINLIFSQLKLRT